MQIHQQAQSYRMHNSAGKTHHKKMAIQNQKLGVFRNQKQLDTICHSVASVDEVVLSIVPVFIPSVSRCATVRHDPRRRKLNKYDQQKPRRVVGGISAWGLSKQSELGQIASE